MTRRTSIYRLAIPAGTVDRLCPVAEQHVQITSVSDTSISFRTDGDISALAVARFLVEDDVQLTTGFGIHRRTVS